MSAPVQDDESASVQIGLRAVKELREINERLRWVLIVLVIPYVLVAIGLLVALLSGGNIEVRVD